MLRELRAQVFSILVELRPEDYNMPIYNKLFRLIQMINEFDNMLNLRQDDLK